MVVPTVPARPGQNVMPRRANASLTIVPHFAPSRRTASSYVAFAASWKDVPGA